MRRKKKKQSKIVLLDKTKLNSIESSISQTLIDLEIIQEEFKITIDEKQRYEQIKESIRNIKSSDKLSESSNYNKKNIDNMQI